MIKKKIVKESLNKLNLRTEDIWNKDGDYLYNNFLDLVELSEFI